jgi:3-oxoacyl-[acyl-carrier-protein] synthase II
MNRVVITGIGVISPIGIGTDGLWKGVLRGASAVRTITRFDASMLQSRIAAEVDGFDPADFLDTKSARRFDRFSQFAVSCAGLALQDARMTIDRSDGIGIGAYIGSALGGVAHAEHEHTRLIEDGFKAVNRLVALSVFTGAGVSNVSIYFGLKGPSLSNANSCASGTVSIGEAYHLIKSGSIEAMLAGGAEAPLSPLCFGAFDLIGAMSRRNATPERASRPFEKERDGFVMGEGAAVFVLEERGHAIRRDAPIYGEVLGYGVTSDAHHMTIPRPDGSQAARAITLALSEAGVLPEQLDYINAHGSSTPLNDKTETLAISTALGESAKKIPISATKAMHGHALGASGAIELAISLLAMKENYIPPTVNLDTADPDCDLDFVPRTGRSAKLSRVLTHSFGFGGTNAALVIGSDEP